MVWELSCIPRPRGKPSVSAVDVGWWERFRMPVAGGSNTQQTRSIKIVRILARLNIGGPAIHAVLLTEGLNDDTARSILVTGKIGSAEGDMLYFARQHGVTPVVIPELGRKISWRDDLVALWKLYRLLAKERPDVVHTHTAKAGSLGRLAAILAGVPVRIHTFHGHVFHGYFGRLTTKLFIVIERILALFTTRIVAISEAQRFDLLCRYRIASAEKFSVIPLGLDLTSFLGNETRTTPMPSATGSVATLGFVGRLVPVKNPCMALNVLAKLARNPLVPRVRLVMVGDGALRTLLQEQVCRLGLETQVVFTGWKRDLAGVYADMDLIVMTSVNEGTPVVLIEAMAAGRPFIATRVGGVVDLVVGTETVFRGETGQPLFSVFANGILTESDDEEGFAAAVAFLLQDRELMKKMGREGRNFVKVRFSKERLVRDISALYRESLAGRAASSEAL